MAGTNTSAQFQSDIEQYIQDKTMPLVQRQLVAYQFGDPLRLPKNRGTTYTASRYDRVPLPYAPLSEGVPPVGETMPLAQVAATAQQWGDKIAITDVADLTIKHDLFQQAIKLTAMALSETLERNTFQTLLAGTQVNYVNSRGSRAALQAGDVLSPYEIIRATGNLATVGAPMYNGQIEADEKIDAGKPSKASSDPRSAPHYVALVHPLSANDFRQNATVQTAWSYSDINRLYNYEIGEWGGIRFCQSNLVPFFTGVAAVTGTASTTGGALATGTYYVQVTASPSLTSQEQRVYQVSGAIAVTGPTGSISVTLPTLPGYVFNVYIGTTAVPVNLAASASGPVAGPLTGQATQLASGSTVILNSVGTAQTPPAAPATGVTVFPLFVLGKNAYGQVMLDDPKFTYLKTADKSDPLNQLRIIGWKVFYGTLIENQNFFMRLEATSAFNGAFG